jgi:molybdopterin/thiamine biosynthesis adenylyltransferase
MVHHRFSNKLNGTNDYPDFCSKLKNYISIISNEAKEIEPLADPRTYQVIVSTEENTVFRYWDSASSRANIMSVSAKLTANRVAIVGLGGTGSYVLDLVAKTPIREIHLFDGDTFRQHNAFRAPGAASVESLEEGSPKVSYFTRIYGEMRTGIIPHNCYLTEDNIHELANFDFAFLCVDKGAVRRVISGFLRGNGIPFVDVGMELLMAPEENCILGTCRATLSTSEKSDHFDRHAPQDDEDGNDLYRSNIQVADMNALNATLAVIKWKQHCGFYQDLVRAHHTTYSVNAHSLTRDEMTGAAGNPS